jgi:hypothetical protein
VGEAALGVGAVAGGAAVLAGSADLAAGYAVARFAPAAGAVGSGTERVINQLRHAGPGLEARGRVVLDYVRSLPGRQQAFIDRLPNGSQVLSGGAGDRGRAYVLHVDGATTIWARNTAKNAFDLVARIMPK